MQPFEKLTPPQQQRLEQRSVLRNFKARETIYFPAGRPKRTRTRQGTRQDSGCHSDGKEAILAFIEEGEIFGELAVIDCEPRNEFAVAAEASRVWRCPVRTCCG